MENTISNKRKRCKNCKWLKIVRHNADYSRGNGTCTQPYRNDCCNVNDRFFSDIACNFFEEREDNNMNKDYIITYLDMATDKVSQKTFHTLLELSNWMEERAVTITNIEEITVGVPDDPKRSKNKYGIGEVLYLPVRVVAIRESSNKEYILYETRTVDNKLITIREDKLVDGIKEV